MNEKEVNALSAVIDRLHALPQESRRTVLGVAW